MLERSQNSYPLLRQFREFYAEVARLRRVIEDAAATGRFPAFAAAASPPSATSPTTMLAPAQSEAVAVAVEAPPHTKGAGEDLDTTARVWRQMALYLDQRMYEVKLAASSLSHDFLNELVYLMAAFADETFVCLVDWPGKDYWQDHLMELRLFDSQIAGQEIYRRIDRLLAGQQDSSDELAAIYLIVLALGFKGQYLNDPVKVESYRRKLFDRLLMTNPDLRSDSPRLFPESYRHTVTEGAPVRLPEPGKWWLVVAGIVGLWLLLSTVAWLRLISSTRDDLAVTMKSLDRVTNRQTISGAPAKWTALPFVLQNGAFRIDLPSSLPLARYVTGNPSAAEVAPLLIAVNGPGGGSAGSASEVAAWLSRGVTASPATLGGIRSDNRTVVSVQQISTPPPGVTADLATLLFTVQPALNDQQLSLSPQLIFPIDGGNGISVGSITLYIPGQSTAGAQ